MRQQLSFRHWRILHKLLVVLLLVSLAPLLAAIGIVVRTSSDALTDETRTNIALLGHSVALRFSNLLLDNHSLLQVAAGNPAITAYLRAPAPANQPVPPGPVDVALSSLPRVNPAIDVVGLYNPRGTVMAHTDRGLLGQNLGGRDFIRTALQGQSFVSAIRRDPVNDRLGMNFSVPVLDQGTVIGAMATHIDGAIFTELFSQTLSDSAGRDDARAITLYLVDPSGIVMSQSQGDDLLYRSLGTLSPEVARRVGEAKPLGGVCPDNGAQCLPKDKIARQPEPLPGLQALGDQVREAFATGRSGSLRFCRPADTRITPLPDRCDGPWHIAAYAPVLLPASMASGGAPVQQFTIVVDLPEQSFLAAVDRQRLFGFGIAAIMALLAIMISLLLARAIAKPINRLATTAGEIEQDKPFEHQRVAEVTTLGDEIGHLARVFSKMVLALQARMAELRTIYQIGRSISSSIDLDETLSYVAHSIQGVVSYDAIELSLLDQLQQKLVVHLALGGDATADDTPRSYARDQGLPGRLLAGGEGMVLSDLDIDSEALDQPPRTWNSLQPRSYLGVPLQVKGITIGAIELVSKQQNGFDADTLRLLESIAMQAAIVIQNAQEVRVRENQLKQKIQELNIEIDEIKRAKQVGEIVESDYFKQLSAQARRFRASRFQQDPPADA